MIRDPYFHAGEVDRQALDAANERAIYYGAMGFLDARTYTLDALAFMAAERISYPSAVAVSLPLSVLAPAVITWGGLDPLDVTPDHGISPKDVRRMSKRDFLRFSYQIVN